MAAKDAKTIWVRLRSNTHPHEWLVHPELLPRMIADANEKGTNLTDLASQILCQHLQVPYAPNVRRSKPTAVKDVLNFGVTPELDRTIRARAALASVRPLDLVRTILCSHYALRVPAKVKRSRVRRPRAAAA